MSIESSKNIIDSEEDKEAAIIDEDEQEVMNIQNTETKSERLLCGYNSRMVEAEKRSGSQVS